MAKRPMQDYAREAKKTKLEMGSSRWRPSPLQNIGGLDPPPPSQSSNSFWDDDDDDVILLASQAAEAKGISLGPTTSGQGITESEITFTEFALKDNIQTSTQKPKNQPLLDNELSQFFQDNDDDLVLVDTLSSKLSGNQSKEVPTSSQKEVFKIPNVPAAPSNIKAQPSNVAVPNISPVASSQCVARRQLAMERQIKYLTDRLSDFKSANAKLNLEVNENKAQLQSKNGEASLLRDEVKHMKHQIQTLKMEKIFSAEAAKTECKNKLAELSRIVEAKESELQLQSMEYTTLKMCQNMSIRNEPDQAVGAKTAVKLKPEEKKRNTKEKRNAMLLKDISSDDVKEISYADLVVNEFNIEDLQSNKHPKKFRTPFDIELEQLEMFIIQMHLKNEKLLTKQQIEMYKAKTVKSVCKIFTEFWCYVHMLDFSNQEVAIPYNDYSLEQDINGKPRLSLHHKKKLYKDECKVNLRRYIAALSVFCRQVPCIAQEILSLRKEDNLLLQTASDAIQKLGESREACEHFGIIEAFASLLYSILLHISVSEQDEQNYMVYSFLKNIIFTQPSPWILRYITDCILHISNFPPIMAMLCTNNDMNTATLNRFQSKYNAFYSLDFLQVYAGLLETAFPINIALDVKCFKLLVAICENHVRFLFGCFSSRPAFMRYWLPPCDNEFDCNNELLNIILASEKLSSGIIKLDDDTTKALEGQPSTSSSSPTHNISLKEEKIDVNCECYIKLCSSVVTLLFKLLREWDRNDKSLETYKVGVISQIGVQLLHIIFRDYYSTLLLRDDEDTTRLHLYLICKWWSENRQLFHFDDTQVSFLQKLQDSHVMPKKIYEEEKLIHISSDLKEWESLTGVPETSNDSASDVSVEFPDQIMKDTANEDIFLEAIKGYAFNFQ